MSDSLRRLAVPAYVLLCLLLGGSVRGLWQIMVLQLLAVALILCVAVTRSSEPLPRQAKTLILIVCLALGTLVIQLLPLPPGIWTRLPDRHLLAESFALQGLPLPALPISLSPYATLSSSLMLLPPIAVLVAMLRWPQDETWLAAAVVLGTFASVVLSAFQVASGGAPSPWYLYDITNTGAVGFFANGNHFGTLLIVGLIVAMAMLAVGFQKDARRRRKPLLLLGGVLGLAICALGLALNHSLAALGLVPPTLLAGVLLFPIGRKARLFAIPAGALALLILLGLLATRPVGQPSATENATSIETRTQIWQDTVELAMKAFPVGTGFGTFDRMYQSTEDPDRVDPVSINHAHNDYLELLLEGGLPALVLLAAFISWWSVLAVRLWHPSDGGTFARAATVASAAIMTHSIVDYPLRATGIAAVFALCLGLMSSARMRGVNVAPSRAQARHVKIA